MLRRGEPLGHGHPRGRGRLREEAEVLRASSWVLALLSCAGIDAQVFIAGSADDFALPPDPASPSAGLVALFAPTPFVSFDTVPNNQLVGHTFDLSGVPETVVSARLIFRVQSTGIPGVETDGVLLVFSAGQTVPCEAIAWGRTFGNYPTGAPGPGIIFDAPDAGIVPGWPTATTEALIELDLAALPLNPNPSVCISPAVADLIPLLQVNGSLDVIVTDETSVDFMILVVNGVFVRGDANHDGALDLSDPIAQLAMLFSGSTPTPCQDALDANDDGATNIADPVFLLAYLFSQGSPPAAPFPACGADATADGLDCSEFAGACP